MMGKFEVLWKICHFEAVLLLSVFATMRHLTIDIHGHFTINSLLNQYGKQPALQLEPKPKDDDISNMMCKLHDVGKKAYIPPERKHPS